MVYIRVRFPDRAQLNILSNNLNYYIKNMIRIEVYSNKYKNGLIPFYKAKSNWAAGEDVVCILPYTPFVEKGIISKEEWMSGHQLIADKLGVEVREFPMDGRKKDAKALPFFNWRKCAIYLETISKMN